MPGPRRRTLPPDSLGSGIAFVAAPSARVEVRPVPAPRRAPDPALPGAPRGRRAAPSLDSAIAATGARVRYSYRLSARPRRGVARAPAKVGAFELETAENEAVVLLRENPDGTTTWLYPEAVPEGRRTPLRGVSRALGPRPSGPRRRRWRCDVTLPRAPAAPARGPARGKRGPRPRRFVGLLAGAIVKVIVFKVVGWAAGELLEHLVRRHETKRMKEGFKRVTADGFPAPGSAPMAMSDWPALSGKRALVFIHGTFSDAQGGFGKLDRATLAELIARYPGGVYAFDHFTLTKDPIANTQLFFDSLPLDQGGLQLDLVTHSRGGLVARSLIELTGQPAVAFGNVVFFGTPNAGTPLADPARLKQGLNLLTNLIKLLPAFAVVMVLGWVVAVVQWVAANGVGKLPGLVAQSPSSEFLKRLNDPLTASDARYAAVNADYEADAGLAAKLKDEALDAFFAAANDLVVPTASVTQVDAAAAEPVLVAGRTWTFQGGRVFHGNFFEQPEARRFLLSLLQ